MRNKIEAKSAVHKHNLHIPRGEWRSIREDLNNNVPAWRMIACGGHVRSDGTVDRSSPKKQKKRTPEDGDFGLCLVPEPPVQPVIYDKKFRQKFDQGEVHFKPVEIPGDQEFMPITTLSNVSRELNS